MSTLRQIEANRRNAQKSTGPTSVTGKAVSSMNSLKTGIHAKSLVLPSENARRPRSSSSTSATSTTIPPPPKPAVFVDDLIYCEWTLRRLRAAETQMWQYQNEDKFRDPEKYPLGRSATSYSASFSKLQYRLDATRRARLRALQALKQLQGRSRRRPSPAPAVEPADPPVPKPRTPNHFTPKLASFRQPPRRSCCSRWFAADESDDGVRVLPVSGHCLAHVLF